MASNLSRRGYLMSTSLLDLNEYKMEEYAWQEPLWKGLGEGDLRGFCLA
jgi:hypothetical protein